MQAFVQKLEELCEANGSFLVPSLEASATLCLGDELQVACCRCALCVCMLTDVWPCVRWLGSTAYQKVGAMVKQRREAVRADSSHLVQEKVTDLILGRLSSAAVADLPAMLQHLLQHVSQANARQVTACP